MCTLVDLFWSLNRCCQPISSHLHPISINFSPISIFPPTISISYQAMFPSWFHQTIPRSPNLLLTLIINPTYLISIQWWDSHLISHQSIPFHLKSDSMWTVSTPSLLNVNQLHPILIAINGKNLLIPCTVSTPSSSPLSLSLHNHSTREATSCCLNIGIRSVEPHLICIICCMPMHL